MYFNSFNAFWVVHQSYFIFLELFYFLTDAVDAIRVGRGRVVLYHHLPVSLNTFRVVLWEVLPNCIANCITKVAHRALIALKEYFFPKDQPDAVDTVRVGCGRVMFDDHLPIALYRHQRVGREDGVREHSAAPRTRDAEPQHPVVRTHLSKYKEIKSNK